MNRRTLHHSLPGLVLGLACTGTALAGAASSKLGPAPLWQPHALPQAAPAPRALPEPSFDPLDRAQVVAAWHNIYLPQEEVPSGWNGNVQECQPGTTSTAYRQAVIDRVNYYRVHAGLPGNITLLGGSEQTSTQRAALMFSANQAITHTPPNSWNCWTQQGADAAYRSLVAYSLGPTSADGRAGDVRVIDLYMDDPGSGNAAVGHRRWLLYPPQVAMDTGSIPRNPAKPSQWATNTTWIGGPYGVRPPTPSGTPWPPRGYVAWQLLPAQSNRWSFSWPGADFSGATVSMERNGTPLPSPVLEPLQQPMADNTVVWQPQDISYTKPMADTEYKVTIAGLAGSGIPSTISYTVTVIDPGDTPPPPAPPLPFADGFEP